MIGHVFSKDCLQIQKSCTDTVLKESQWEPKSHASCGSVVSNGRTGTFLLSRSSDPGHGYPCVLNEIDSKCTRSFDYWIKYVSFILFCIYVASESLLISEKDIHMLLYWIVIELCSETVTAAYFYYFIWVKLVHELHINMSWGDR